MNVDLSRYDNSWFDPGRRCVLRALWFVANSLVMQNPANPSSSLRSVVLRCFGGRVGPGVIVKPGVNVKYPWHLEIGAHSWVGEDVWLDSLAPIRIGSNVCISQGAYLCTGNHDWSDPAFGLIVKPITVEDGAWIGAKAIICPGVTISTHSVVTAGSVVTKDTEPYMIYAGNPAVAVRRREIRGG